MYHHLWEWKAAIILKVLVKAKNENLAASFTGRSIKINNSNLIKECFLMPFMTIKIIAGIHYEALLLFLKGLKFYKCPKERKSNVTN